MATVLLQNVGASTATFTQKLQLAATSSTYPLGTTFDCTFYTNQNITSTISFTRANNTFIFGAGVFSYTATSGNMFEIAAQGITITGVNRNARDVGGGTTAFSMGGGLNLGYHIYYKVVSVPIGTVKGDCLVVKNCSFKGAQSVYTQNNGNVQYTTQGGGGIFAMESNPGALGQNLNNVIIDNVLVDGAKQHGIFLYGPIACKVTNTRVRSAAGHGFYIDGEGTSTSFDTCYASGNYLAGFCLKDAAYSSLLNCASDSNGLGYWLRNSTSTTLVSCGAEGSVIRSNIPNNLGITIPGSTQNPGVSVNDIGSDNVNHIKGTSFFISGGSYITLTSPISKDPGNGPGSSTYVNKRTAHFGFYGSTSNVTITSPRRSGTTPVKYSYRLEALSGLAPSRITIGESTLTYDPLNPNETPDTNLLPVANILDQGDKNLFIAGGYDQSATGKDTNILDPEYHRINNLSVTSKLTIPTYPSHPEADTDTTIYFNSTNKKLYMWQDGVWYDTCCSEPTPPPLCYFPGNFGLAPTNGAIPLAGMNQQRGTFSRAIVGDKIFAPLTFANNVPSVWNTTIGLQSYDMITNTVLSYPNTLNMRLANSLVVGYNSNNELGLYFAGLLPIPGSGGQQIPPFNPTVGVPFRSVVGFYNLSTGVCITGIDTVIDDYDMQSVDMLGAYRMIKLEGTDKLIFLSPNDGIISVSTENWTVLDVIPFFGDSVQSTVMGPLNSQVMGFDGTQTFYENGGEIVVIPRNTTFAQGLPATVSVINLISGEISSVPSSNDQVNDNYNKTNLISKDPESGNLIVVNGTLRSIAEIDISDYSIINEWVIGTVNDIIGYPTFYTSNGVRYALYYKFTVSSVTGGTWTTTINNYNLTDSILEGSISVPDIIGTLSPGPFVTEWEDGNSFSANSFIDIPIYSVESLHIYFPYTALFQTMYRVCKPYYTIG